MRSNDNAPTLPRLCACRSHPQALPSRPSPSENSIAPGAAANPHRVQSNEVFASALRAKTLNSFYKRFKRAQGNVLTLRPCCLRWQKRPFPNCPSTNKMCTDIACSKRRAGLRSRRKYSLPKVQFVRACERNRGAEYIRNGLLAAAPANLPRLRLFVRRSSRFARARLGSWHAMGGRARRLGLPGLRNAKKRF